MTTKIGLVFNDRNDDDVVVELWRYGEKIDEREYKRRDGQVFGIRLAPGENLVIRRRSDMLEAITGEADAGA